MLTPLCIAPGYISLISVQHADAEVLALCVNAEMIRRVLDAPQHQGRIE